MSFEPVVPATGIVGWNFLQATYDRQFEAFSQAPILEREGEYFLENIGDIKTAEDLIKDRRLLDMALGAFGLSEEIDKKALIQKVLEDGANADDALSKRLGDERWVSFTEAFGFGPGEIVKTGSIEDMKNIVFTNTQQGFEEAVGYQDESMRIAMYATREIPNLVTEDTSEDAKIYSILGQQAIREYFETILNLPKEFAQIDIDQQFEIMKEKLEGQFGSSDLSMLADSEVMDDLTIKYLARAELKAFEESQSAGSIALTLLSQ